jgi:hypothetical protein
MDLLAGGTGCARLLRSPRRWCDLRRCTLGLNNDALALWGFRLLPGWLRTRTNLFVHCRPLLYCIKKMGGETASSDLAP